MTQIINPATVNLSSPTPIGNVTPNTGAFTTLNASTITASGLVTGTTGLFTPSNLGAVAHGQGAYIEWNKSGGQGETNFINQKGGGVGGFGWYDISADGATLTQRMYLDSSSNLTVVGGITSTKSGVAFNGNGNATATVTADISIQRTGSENASVGQGSNIQLGNGTSGNQILLQNYQGNFQFYSYTSSWIERMRLTSSGRLLVNTTTDDGVSVLQVTGPVISTDNITASKSLKVLDSSANAINFSSPGGYINYNQSGYNDLEFVVSNSSGNGLFIWGRADSSNNFYRSMIIYGNNSVVMDGNSLILGQSGSGAAITIGNNGASSSQVYIPTTATGTPNIQLDANSSYGATFMVNASGSTFQNLPPSSYGFGTVGALPFVLTTAATERLRVGGSSGNLLVNTTTDDGLSKLQVAGNVKITSGSIQTTGAISGTAQSGIGTHLSIANGSATFTDSNSGTVSNFILTEAVLNTVYYSANSATTYTDGVCSLFIPSAPQASSNVTFSGRVTALLIGSGGAVINGDILLGSGYYGYTGSTSSQAGKGSITIGGTGINGYSVTTPGIRTRFVTDTHTDTTSSGTVSTPLYNHYIGAPSLAASNAVTYNNGTYNLYVAGAPTAGSNVTLPSASNFAFGTGGAASIGGKLVVTGRIVGNGANDDGLTGLQIAGTASIGGSTNIVGGYLATSGNFSTSAVASGIGRIFGILPSTHTDTSSSGTNANIQAASSFGIPTFASTNTANYTGISSTVYISGAPVSGTNTTLTGAKYSLYVANGNTYFGNNVTIATGGFTVTTGTVSIGFGTASTIGIGTGTVANTVSISNGTAGSILNLAGATTNLTGSVVTTNNRVDTSTVYSAFATGGTLTLSQTVRKTINTTTTTIASYTVKTPASPVNGQECYFITAGTITAFTLTATSGTLAGLSYAGVQLNAGTKIMLSYSSATTTWYVSN